MIRLSGLSHRFAGVLPIVCSVLVAMVLFSLGRNIRSYLTASSSDFVAGNNSGAEKEAGAEAEAEAGAVAAGGSSASASACWGPIVGAAAAGAGGAAAGSSSASAPKHMRISPATKRGAAAAPAAGQKKEVRWSDGPLYRHLPYIDTFLI